MHHMKLGNNNTFCHAFMSRTPKLSTQNCLWDLLHKPTPMGSPGNSLIIFTGGQGHGQGGWLTVLLEVTQGAPAEWWREETLNLPNKAAVNHLNRDLSTFSAATHWDSRKYKWHLHTTNVGGLWTDHSGSKPLFLREGTSEWCQRPSNKKNDMFN